MVESLMLLPYLKEYEREGIEQLEMVFAPSSRCSRACWLALSLALHPGSELHSPCWCRLCPRFFLVSYCSSLCAHLSDQTMFKEPLLPAFKLPKGLGGASVGGNDVPVLRFVLGKNCFYYMKQKW